MREMKCKRCKSDPNLYVCESGALYTLACVDVSMIIGAKETRETCEAFIKNCPIECFLKVTGELTEGSEHSFLGRRLEA